MYSLILILLPFFFLLESWSEILTIEMYYKSHSNMDSDILSNGKNFTKKMTKSRILKFHEAYFSNSNKYFLTRIGV